MVIQYDKQFQTIIINNNNNSVLHLVFYIIEIRAKPVFAPFLQTLVITLSIQTLSLKNSFCSQISGDCNQTFNHTLEHTNQTFVLSPGKASTLARGAHRSTQTHNLTFAPKPEESNISNSH